MKQKTKNLINHIGIETEINAKPILEKEFEEVEWISNNKPTSPYDFICKDSGEVFYVDVKSCINGIIYTGKNKFNKLKNKELGNFYFLLYKDYSFHLISFEDLLKDKRYKIIFKKYRYNNINYDPTKKAVMLRNVDIDLWNWFVGYCKQKGKNVGEVIEDIINKIKKGKLNH